MNKLHVTQVHYCLPMELRKFRKLTKIDDEDFGETVKETLAGLPVGETEFNGHFGANFFFSIDIEDGSVRTATKYAKQVERRIAKLLK